ncbi:hypothetical protein DSO57_1013235 [Entomophthora muscae]|uniref:Uncharacterized protein n=1 Tax=Entomophthora muscae TaxID=34485 RepID=A0ACC2TTG6_9FUNG|nr:hypothetical protein DSO57_1013235 [Entomophthora muscae]
MLPKKLTNFLNYRYGNVSSLQRCMMRCPVMIINYVSLLPVPLAILTFLYLLMTRKWSLADYFLFAWSSCEMVFFLSWRKKMQEPFKHKPFAVALSQRLAFAKHFLDHAVNIQELFPHRMVERPDGPLHLDHFKPLIDFEFFDKKAQDMTYEEKKVAEQIYHTFEEKSPLTLTLTSHQRSAALLAKPRMSFLPIPSRLLPT